MTRSHSASVYERRKATAEYYDNRVKRALTKARKTLNRAELTATDKKKHETEIMWILKEINDYGFYFEPEHYVAPLIKKIENYSV